jgi:hypothetical protein
MLEFLTTQNCFDYETLSPIPPGCDHSFLLFPFLLPHIHYFNSLPPQLFSFLSLHFFPLDFSHFTGHSNHSCYFPQLAFSLVFILYLPSKTRVGPESISFHIHIGAHGLSWKSHTALYRRVTQYNMAADLNQPSESFGSPFIYPWPVFCPICLMSNLVSSLQLTYNGLTYNFLTLQWCKSYTQSVYTVLPVLKFDLSLDSQYPGQAAAPSWPQDHTGKQPIFSSVLTLLLKLWCSMG